MNNSVNLYSISELLEKKFFVPSYQRGYRWTEQQVKELLDDIFSFATKKKADGEFYCLQPIVVKKRLDDDKSYELIDGQQRLTTLKILLEYLEKVHLGNGTLKQEYGKDIFSIKYETREKTSDFLKNISQNTSEENIDFYLISEAYKTIDAWFKSHEKPKFVRESIIRTLVFGNDGPCPEGVVKVIWYELESDPIESFKRINTGKIPLTNAELIRALLLQFKNFENEDSGSRIQLEMATEWDNIEHALQDENFWWFLNKSQNDTPARIQFIFDYMYRLSRKTDEAKALERYGNDKYSTFRYFNELIKISKANEIWADVKKFFSAFSDWYENSKWYHYIGYLIFCGEDIEDIYNIYKKSTKDEFTKSLIGKIKDSIDKKEISELTYDDGNDKKCMRKLLLLYNIEYIVSHSGKGKESDSEEYENEIFERFPFKPFKKESWDLEHIDSYTENAITDFESQKKWLELASSDLDINSDIKKKLHAKIEEFYSSTTKDRADLFNNLKQEVIRYAGEDPGNNEKQKNSIGNITLLNRHINRSYGNAIFPTKRRIIIEHDRDGKFIPHCTRNVFLKYFNPKGGSLVKWSSDDIAAYMLDIQNTIKVFLS